MAGLPPGTQIGSFILVRRVGEGAFGEVYEALKQPLGKRVALKVLHRERAGSGQVVERFFQEARAAAALKHLHIVDVDDIGVHEGLPYIAMEFLQGQSLAAFLKARRVPLTPSEALDLLLPVFSAVAAVHDANIVHRDLKPDNIILWNDRPGHVHPKLLDFGIAKLNDGAAAQMTATGASLGTPLYMAPEQWRGSKHATAASDQWALAAITYQCLTLALPFVGDDLHELMFKVVSESATPLRASLPGIDPRLDAVVLGAMEKKPEARYPSVREFARALMPWASVDARARWSSEFGASSAASASGRSPFEATMDVPLPPAPPSIGLSSGGPFESAGPIFRESPRPQGAQSLSNDAVRGGTMVSSPAPTLTSAPSRPRRSYAGILVGLGVGGAVLGFALFTVFRNPQAPTAMPLAASSNIASAPAPSPAALPAPAWATELAAAPTPSTPEPTPVPTPEPPPTPAAPEPAPAPAEPEPAPPAPPPSAPTAAEPAARAATAPVAQPLAAPSAARRERTRGPTATTAPAAAAARPEPMPPPSGGGGGMDGARTCVRSGQPQPQINRCIVGALRGSASSEEELRVLCMTYRLMGDRANAVSCMRRYVQRYPSARYTEQFNEYITGE